MILITGANGFIGTHLCKKLQEKMVPFLKFSGNINSPEDIEQVLKNNQIEAVIHLAGVYKGDFMFQYSINVVGTMNLLNAMSRFGVKKIIFASTGALYGNRTGIASKEDDVLNPSTEYEWTKKIAEDTIMSFLGFSGITGIILRFPNIYGKGSQGVIDKFYESINNNGTISVSGDGLQLRNYLYINDAIESILLAIQYKHSDIFNVTTPTPFSLLEIIKFLKEKYNFDVIKKQDNNRVRHVVLSPLKTKELLGFEAKNTEILLQY